jgi:P-type Ca2+ transporter type 2C
MDQQRNLDFYRLTPEETLTELRSKAEGLSGTDAAERLRQFGANVLAVGKKNSWVTTYLRKFRDLMILLLIGSALLSFYLDDSRTGVVLIALVLFNTTIGFLQEFKAEKLMASLEKLVVAKASVYRDGRLIEVPSAELVDGDVVYIEEGDSVPADIRILSEDELSTNDFALTGESNPTRKFVHAISADVPLGNRQNLCFMGTTVATGHGNGVVVGTAMRSELGRIASLSQDTKHEDSPLQKEMNNIATRVAQGTVVLCVVLLPLAIKGGLNVREAFLFAIGIASSIIPQGLPAEINTALARAANKLVKARALVKKLSAVETLGATSVILTDKTGTLTKNQMTIEQFKIGNDIYTVDGRGYEPVGTISKNNQPLDTQNLEALSLFFTAGALASNAHVNQPDSEHAVWYCIGDPTEGAVVTLALKGGLNLSDIDSQYPEVKEFAFDSARKRMSSVRYYGDKKQLHAFVKGAPENILERCTQLWDGTKIRSLTAKDKTEILSQNTALAAKAMRNLAFAYRVLPEGNPKQLVMDETESELVWLGMVSMIDPLREEVPDAMQAARAAHIKVSIVTGDYAVTAQAIAARAKLTDDTETTVVSGEELQKLSDTQVLNLARQGGVIFSRVAPEDKLRIVGLVRESGRVVAVTGDGINDAPALKRADIGVAMGLTGTDVAKQSAEIVLLDDSFNTLVNSVQEGRTIFQNIKKGTLSCFTSNSAELVVNLISLACATVLHVPLAMSVMELLAIDMVAELFPIAALGWDRADGDLMHDRPRNPHDHILNKQAIIDLIWCGIMIGGFAFMNYIWFYYRHNANPGSVATGSDLHMQATALTYLTIVICQLCNILQRRSRDGFFSRYQLHNKQLWFAMALSLFCVANIIYNPWVAPYFQAKALDITDWLYALAAAALFIGIRETQRLYLKKSGQKTLTETAQ